MLREWVPGGIKLPQAIAVAKLLENEGIAYLSATEGTFNSIFFGDVMKKMSQPAYLRKDMEKLTGGIKVPTIISGRILGPSLANELIREKTADLIGLGRPLRVDFNWVKKAKKQNQKIISCTNCNWCLKRVVLDQGFSCRRWPKMIQQRADLDHQLLTRNYKGLNGSVSDTILECAKTENYGTIIMGKRGLSGIKRWLLGSVSSGVLRGLTGQSLFLID